MFFYKVKVPRRVFFVFLLLSVSVYSAPSTVELFIPNAPPLTFENNVMGHGIVGDVVLVSIAKAGYIAHVKVLPWARAQKHVSRRQDILIAPLSRTPEREHNFTWIAPIMPMERAFFSLSKQVKNYEEAKKEYSLIGVGLGSAQEEILRTQGFRREQIIELPIGENPALMLLRGRIDAWFNGVPESLYIWHEVSEKKATYESSYGYSRSLLGMLEAMFCSNGTAVARGYL